jgi:hypothetical protein
LLPLAVRSLYSAMASMKLFPHCRSGWQVLHTPQAKHDFRRNAGRLVYTTYEKHELGPHPPLRQVGTRYDPADPSPKYKRVV